MRYLFLIFFLCGITQAQIYRDLDIYKGDSHTLYFEADGDVSSDSLMFVVKADRDDDTPRVITRRNTAGGGGDTQIKVIYSTKSTILVKLTQTNTEGLTAATYVYDLTVDSTTTLYTGYLKLRDEVSGSADGVATSTPYYTVALDTPNASPSFPIGQDSDNGWDVVSAGAHIDTLAKQRHRYGVLNVLEYGVKGDGSNERVALQAAFDIANDSGWTIWMPNPGNGIYIDDPGWDKKGYASDSTIVNKSSPIIMDAPLYYVGTRADGSAGKLTLTGYPVKNDTLLICGETGVNFNDFSGSIIRVMAVGNARTGSEGVGADSTVGVVLKNVRKAHFRIEDARYFFTNALLIGDMASFGGNVIHINNFLGGYVMLHIMDRGTGGFTGNNLIIGGRFQQQFMLLDLPVTMIMLSSGGNTFIQPQLQAFRNEFSTGIHCKSNNNTFIDVWGESSFPVVDSTHYALKLTDNATQNKFEFTVATNLTYSLAGGLYPNIVTNPQVTALGYTGEQVLLFRANDLSKITNVYSNDLANNKQTYYIRGMSFIRGFAVVPWSVQDTIPVKDTYNLFKTDNGINLSRSLAMGVMVDCEDIKEYSLAVSFKRDTTTSYSPAIDSVGVPFIILYDSLGATITADSSINGLTSSMSHRYWDYDNTRLKGHTGIASFVFSADGQIGQLREYFSLPTTAKTAFIGITGKTADVFGGNTYSNDLVDYTSFALYANQETSTWAGYDDSSNTTDLPLALDVGGKWQRGSVIYNDTVNSGGHIGWVATTGGVVFTEDRADATVYSYQGFHAMFSDSTMWVTQKIGATSYAEPTITGKQIGEFVQDSTVVWRKVGKQGGVFKTFGKID